MLIRLKLVLLNTTEVAIDIVAENLIPESGAIEESRGREKSFNALGYNVLAREVRGVEPGKLIIYVSLQVTKNLIPSIQDDFVDVEL